MKDIYKVLENFASDALIDKDEYIKMYNESINDSKASGRNSQENQLD